MAQGDKFQSTRTVFHDPRTGREVWKMTSWDEHHCAATYMYLRAFSGDERYLIFASDRGGRFELYRLEIESGETVQVTEHKAQDMDDKSLLRCNVHPNGKEVFYPDGAGFFASDIETLEKREVARMTDDSWSGIHGGPTFAGNGRYVLCIYSTRDGLCGIAWADVLGGRFEDLYRWPHKGESFSHVQAAYTDEPIISFVPAPDRQNDPKETRERRARSWKFDAATGKAEPFLVMPPGHRATHEYWGPKGNARLYFHRKTVPTWTPTSIASIAIDGTDYIEHYASDDRRLGHSFVSPDCRRIVSDVQDAKGNELILIELPSGKSEVLCWPDSTLADGTTGHVHPSFSPSGSKVIYTSDKSGKAAVFLVPLA
jgi:oligogalacturonide lyase